MKLSKKILAGLMAGTFFFGGITAPVSAAPPPPPQQMSEADRASLAKEIAAQYDVNEQEVLTALKEDRFMDDIYYAAMLAKVSGKSFRQVFAMKSDWFDVMKALGITEEKYNETMREMVAEDIAERSELDINTVKKLMEQHYFPRDIRIAGRLAKASGKNVQEVLDMKKINRRWKDVAKELGVDPGLVRPRNAAEEEEDAEQNQNGNQPREQR